eukprot:TRINITY_DN68385_c0_g1_i1.p1 TRINITY_DN68385_c0_g1~~TRINITY_DN68385_c0_g1_i1.p1  ORF type:complete len:384 (+),score=69.36 TRINITY_DN68385_c0_g1_i1:103-1254(+)
MAKLPGRLVNTLCSQDPQVSTLSQNVNTAFSDSQQVELANIRKQVDAVLRDAKQEIARLSEIVARAGSGSEYAIIRKQFMDEREARVSLSNVVDGLIASREREASDRDALMRGIDAVRETFVKFHDSEIDARRREECQRSQLLKEMREERLARHALEERFEEVRLCKEDILALLCGDVIDLDVHQDAVCKAVVEKLSQLCPGIRDSKNFLEDSKSCDEPGSIAELARMIRQVIISVDGERETRKRLVASVEAGQASLRGLERIVEAEREARLALVDMYKLDRTAQAQTDLMQHPRRSFTAVEQETQSTCRLDLARIRLRSDEVTSDARKISLQETVMGGFAAGEAAAKHWQPLCLSMTSVSCRGSDRASVLDRRSSITDTIQE